MERRDRQEYQQVLTLFFQKRKCTPMICFFKINKLINMSISISKMQRSQRKSGTSHGEIEFNKMSLVILKISMLSQNC